MTDRRNPHFAVLIAFCAGIVACGPRVVRPPHVSSAEPAEIVVVRPKDDGGLAVQLVVDEQKLATTKSGESVTFRLDPGLHRLEARVYRFPSFFSKRSTEFHAVAAQTHYFLLHAGTFAMPPYVTPVDPETGRRESAETTPLPTQ